MVGGKRESDDVTNELERLVRRIYCLARFHDEHVVNIYENAAPEELG